MRDGDVALLPDMITAVASEEWVHADELGVRRGSLHEKVGMRSVGGRKDRRVMSAVDLQTRGRWQR